MRLSFVLFLGLVLLSGCAVTGPTAHDTPQSLAEVNARLDGATATVVLTGGRRLQRVRDVWVSETEVTYRDRRRLQAVPTTSVVRIETPTGRGALAGAGTGFGVGAAVTGSLLVVSSGDSFGQLALAGLGMAGTVVSTVVGAALGQAGSAAVVYQAPFADYLQHPLK